MEMALHLFEGYGIELEYMIVNDSLDVNPLADKIFEEVAGENSSDYETKDIAWSNELALHIIELKCKGPAVTLQSLPEKFNINIKHINSILKQHKSRLMPTAMHPWMDPLKDT